MWCRMKGEKKFITGINSEVAWIKWQKVSVIFTTYCKMYDFYSGFNVGIKKKLTFCQLTKTFL